MRTLGIGGAVLALALMGSGQPPADFNAPGRQTNTKPGVPGGKGAAACGFLPVAVPGGQGGRVIYVVPEDVVAIRANDVKNTSTTIFFRHQHAIQVSAPDAEVLKALQSDKRVRPGRP
jgi:hypothetical protein